MLLDVTLTTTASLTMRSGETGNDAIGEFFETPLLHQLVPIIIMTFILLLLLVACIYDCKVNRDCFDIVQSKYYLCTPPILWFV
ncbi:hypothetical protein AB6A40_006465 [Gnathostoma spinigerum]|uniref:Uncharacterized protein n=1 Tax=Gnathostoma spinigerum TaxID=75299 RepID=A0ABD6EKJ3_9BILA